MTKLRESEDAKEKVELELEIERLEAVLGNDVGEWEKRVGEIKQELSGKKVAKDDFHGVLAG